MQSLFELSQLLQDQQQGPDVLINAVSTDTRSLQPGDLFVAIAGPQFDGHNFIPEAQARGAIAAVVQRPMAAQIPLLVVADTQRALGQLAQQHRLSFSLPVIAVTGSCGKTTTREMLRAILEQCGPVLASIKSFNNEIGVPLTLLRLQTAHRFAVIELGANRPGEIAYLTRLVKPKVALITGANAGHLEGFGSIAGVAQAKAEIFMGLEPTGIAIINADDPFVGYWQALLSDYTVIRFGIQQPADCRARITHIDSRGQASFKLFTPKGTIYVQLPLAGYHNVSNAAAAAAAALVVGAPLSAIKSGLETMFPVPGRLVNKQGLAAAQILDDSYNANPSSVEAALQVLAHYSGQRVFVFGGMAELGADSAVYHRQIGQCARRLGIEQVYTCGELAYWTTKGFGQQAKHFSNQSHLLAALRPQLRADMTLLIKGSRSMHMEHIVAALQAE